MKWWHKQLKLKKIFKNVKEKYWRNKKNAEEWNHGLYIEKETSNN